MARIEVRPVGGNDVADFARMVREMGEFYGGSMPCSEDEVAALAVNVLHAERSSQALLARVDGVPAGIATYTLPWPTTRLRPAMYLKDLFVSERVRGQGIGKLIMARLAAIARDRGLSRIDWTTEHDNAAARALYEGLGAAVQTRKVSYRLDGEALERLAIASGEVARV